MPDCDGAPDFTRPINGDTCFTLLNQRSFGIHSEIASTEQYCLLGYRTPELCGCPNEVKPFTLVSKCLVLDPSIQSYKFIEVSWQSFPPFGHPTDEWLDQGVCPLVIC